MTGVALDAGSPGAMTLPPSRPFRTEHGSCVFTIDVEDWFHIMDLPAAPRLDQWQALPSVVERTFRNLLDTAEQSGVRATCFFLGWIAERYPALVRDAIARGHEVASHGYAHDLVYELPPARFAEDVSKAKSLLEDIAGRAVRGYRAPGFSVTPETPWFFEALARAGYSYSSSIFPASRQHGGFARFGSAPCIVETASGELVEFPIPVARMLGRQTCFFGGGYLRLFPYILISRMARQVHDDGRPVIFYIHPREVDPGHPRLSMPALRRFKTYVGLGTTRQKLARLLREFSFVTFSDLIGKGPAGAASS
jgi:polysaccharide deacetylase family protein (PEP-CTERM system associated)